MNNGKPDIDRILSIQGRRDYYDDGDLDKKEFDELYQILVNNQTIVEELKNLRDFHSGKVTVPRFSHADILNELVILLKTTDHSGGKNA